MKKINQFIKFDTNAFFKGKRLVYKDGVIVNTEKFKGAKLNLIIDRDETQYESQEDKGVNELEIFSIKVPNVDETYLKQFQRRMPVILENVIAKPYVNIMGDRMAQISISFTGMVKPQHNN